MKVIKNDESAESDNTLESKTRNHINFSSIYQKLSKHEKERLIGKFFTINISNEHVVSTCNVEKCNQIFKHKKNYNLIRHLILMHKRIFDEFIGTLSLQKRQKHHIQNIFKADDHKVKEIIVHDSLHNFEKKIIDILKTGASFRFFEVSGFKDLIRDHCDVLKIKLSRYSITKILEKHYSASVKNIIKEVENKIINIKLDGVSIHNRYFLGVNIQYYFEKQIKIMNIGLEEIMGPTTSEVLLTHLRRILSTYNIKLEQIFSIVTDNGANYLKIGRLLKDEISQEKTCHYDEKMYLEYNEEVEEEEISSDSEIFYGMVQGCSDLDDILTYDLSEFGINLVKCGCHTLQLAISDSLKSNVAFVQEVRNLVKYLRTPIYRNKLKTRKIKVPVIDVVTRWNSTYAMIKSFLDIREFILEENIKSISTEEKFYLLAKAEEFVKNYKSLVDCTLKFQEANLLYSDFAYNWMNLLKVYSKKEKESESYKGIYQALLNRSEKILAEKELFASMYLDPRYRDYALTNDVILKEINSCLYKSFYFIENRNMLSLSTHTIENNDEKNFNSIFNIFLDSKYAKDIKESEKRCISALKKEIFKYENFVFNEDIINIDPLNFWTEMENDFRLLSKIAICLLTTPSSQVSVERLFSTLKFLLNPLRSNIGNENLKMILHLTNNSN